LSGVEPSGHRATPGGWSTERVIPLTCLLPPRSRVTHAALTFTGSPETATMATSILNLCGSFPRRDTAFLAAPVK